MPNPVDDLRQAVTRLRIGMWTIHPDLANPLTEVFEAWARIGDLDPDILNRVGGPETIALARAVNGRKPPAPPVQCPAPEEQP
jgi:hypothetical protein